MRGRRLHSVQGSRGEAYLPFVSKDVRFISSARDGDISDHPGMLSHITSKAHRQTSKHHDNERPQGWSTPFYGFNISFSHYEKEQENLPTFV
jgi:hypothetical protein